jgi:hypothetical protein
VALTVALSVALNASHFDKLNSSHPWGFYVLSDGFYVFVEGKTLGGLIRNPVFKVKYCK